VDIEQFELDLCKYLNAYAAGQFQDNSPASERWATDRSVGHISLLLATLSAGAHYSDLEHPQRSEICQDLGMNVYLWENAGNAYNLQLVGLFKLFV